MKSGLEEKGKGLADFLSSVKKLNKSRIHKINNSLGVYDSYKWIRKNKWLNIGRPLTEHEFYSIIRKVNEYLAIELENGNDVKLPCRMGRLELRKFDAKINIVNGKVKTNLPVDWNRTLNLWYEDEEAYKNKTLIKVEEKEIFKVFYNRQLADYNNKSFYKFEISRSIKKNLKNNIKEGKIDAFKI